MNNKFKYALLFALSAISIQNAEAFQTPNSDRDSNNLTPPSVHSKCSTDSFDYGDENLPENRLNAIIAMGSPQSMAEEASVINNQSILSYSSFSSTHSTSEESDDDSIFSLFGTSNSQYRTPLSVRKRSIGLLEYRTPEYSYKRNRTLESPKAAIPPSIIITTQPNFTNAGYLSSFTVTPISRTNNPFYSLMNTPMMQEAIQILASMHHNSHSLTNSTTHQSVNIVSPEEFFHGSIQDLNIPATPVDQSALFSNISTISPDNEIINLSHHFNSITDDNYSSAASSPETTITHISTPSTPVRVIHRLTLSEDEMESISILNDLFD